MTMLTKALAALVATTLILSIVGVAYAQQQNATGIQIQLIPEIQRGHKQHLTLYAVDDQGNQINGTQIISQLTNEAGLSVGPGVVSSQSGQDVIYKVGPNTRPQNISVFSYIEGTNIDAAQEYAVFPKGQAQVPANDTALPEVLPPPVVNETIPPAPTNETLPPITANGTLPPITENATIPPIINASIPENATLTPSSNITITENVTLPPTVNFTIPNATITNATITNASETNNGNIDPGTLPVVIVSGNATEAFSALENATALLDQKIQDIDDSNETERQELKGLMGDSALAIGGISSLVVNATDDNLQVFQDSAASISEAIDIVRDEGE